jgi:uncharacterized protein (UPF0335 family)
MTDRYYDTSAGEFIDFETLDDWAARDAAKDARIEALEAKLERAEEFTRALVERIKSLEAEQNRLSQQCEGLAQAASNNGQALIISESKLAKAIGTLELIQTIDVHEPCGEDLGTCGRLARDTIAEIEGTHHDRPTTES